MYEVSLPIFANAQANIESVRRFFVRALRIVCFLVFPLMFGLAAVSQEAVDLLLGIKWAETAPLVLILSLSMPARIIGNLFPPALQGTGHPKTSLTNLMIAVFLIVPALAIAAVYGTTAVALAWLIVFPLVMLIIIARSRKMIGVHWIDVGRALVPTVVASFLMFVAVLYSGLFMSNAGVSIETRLPMMIFIGVAVFAALSYVGLREQLREVLNIMRKD